MSEVGKIAFLQMMLQNVSVVALLTKKVLLQLSNASAVFCYILCGDDMLLYVSFLC